MAASAPMFLRQSVFYSGFRKDICTDQLCLLKETDTRFDEDDFTNIFNGYQYVLDDLKSAYRSLSSASMQCQFIIDDEKALRREYD